MSTYDDYRKRVKDLASKLKPIKEPDQTILWLKAAATERINLDVDNYDLDGELYVGKTGEDSFGFKEKTVNLLLQYAFEAGEKKAKENAAVQIKHMRDTITEVVEACEDFIDYPEF